VDAITIPQLSPPPPQDLLAARPDVRATEALIEAAKGDVAQARAAFFPQIGISLQGLLESATGGPLGTSLKIGSSLLAPIFSRGRLESDFQFASAAQVEAAERYRKTIVGALAEVEDARSAGCRWQFASRRCCAMMPPPPENNNDDDAADLPFAAVRL